MLGEQSDRWYGVHRCLNISTRKCRYDRLREHAVSYLSQQYSDRAIQDALPEVIERIVLGDMPHAGGVLRSLLGLRVAVSDPRPGLRLSALCRVLAGSVPPGPATPPTAPNDMKDARPISSESETPAAAWANVSTFSFFHSPQALPPASSRPGTTPSALVAEVAQSSSHIASEEDVADEGSTTIKKKKAKHRRRYES